MKISSFFIWGIGRYCLMSGGDLWGAGGWGGEMGDCCWRTMRTKRTI